MNFPNRKFQNLLGIELPLIQAPMAGADSVELAIAVAKAGGLGSLAAALLTENSLRDAYQKFQAATPAPLNMNFFCHQMPVADSQLEARWRKALIPFYVELGLDQNDIRETPLRRPFDEALCRMVEELRPRVVSFHFGLPNQDLLRRVKALGTKVLSTATTVEEAVWLEARGCDAIIAQGAEAGGHRGMFLASNPAAQVGTFALVPQVADAVKIPVIAAGGIADGRGIAAALTLGACAVQIGTAYLFCPEAKVSPVYRAALRSVRDDQTVLTNVFSGRPARGILNRIVESLGVMSDDAPAFPLASTAIAPLRAKSEAIGSPDFQQMWAGQAARLGQELPAGELTRKLSMEALGCLLNQQQTAHETVNFD
jgi:nitronate monooxygenase